MSYAKDLTGSRFGRLTVLSRNYDKQTELYNNKRQYKAFWNCICDCGKTTIVGSSNLLNKNNPTISCGCYKKEVSQKQKNTKSITWINKGETTIGITTSGEKFYIDSEDLGKVRSYCWRIDSKGYVVANSKDGTNKTIRLHRVLMDADSKTLIDHKNWDKTDNRKHNLRIASKSQNNINIKRKSNNTSGYPGITLNKRGHYVARISVDGVRYYLGTYENFKEAVIARRKAEIKLHKEWAGENNKHDFDKIINIK